MWIVYFILACIGIVMAHGVIVVVICAIFGGNRYPDENGLDEIFDEAEAEYGRDGSGYEVKGGQ